MFSYVPVEATVKAVVCLLVCVGAVRVIKGPDLLSGCPSYEAVVEASLFVILSVATIGFLPVKEAV